MNLPDAARDKPCLVRMPGVCNGDESTTVLAHIKIPGLGGMGKKPPDLCATWACSSCHDVIDGRARHPGGMTDEFVQHCAKDGMLRTLDYLSRNGQFYTLRGSIQWRPN